MGENVYQDPVNPVFQPGIRDERVMSVSDWLVTMLLMIIPLVNLILLIVWAASDTGNRNRRNWARASLIMAAIMIGIYILIFIAAFGIAATHQNFY